METMNIIYSTTDVVNFVSMSQVVCHRYWPIENSTSEVFHHFSVKLINEIKVSESMVRRTLGMKDMNVRYTCHKYTYSTFIFLRVVSVKQLFNFK